MADQNQSILELQPPSVEAFKQRICFIAKALAYGVQTDRWSARILVGSLNLPPSSIDAAGSYEPGKLVGESWEAQGHPNYQGRLHRYLKEIWEFQQPQASFLEVYGFLERKGQIGNQTEYMVTPTALALLDEPRFKKVFISYRRQESSAFALLLHDRLKQALFEPFIDLRSIEPGEQFQNRIDAEIDASEVFICLVGTTTFTSKYVMAEIDRALSRSMIAVPIWHNNFIYKKGTFRGIKNDFFSKTNAIVVDPENVNGYDNAYKELIQFLQRP